jgi:TonB family protein
LLAVVIAEDGLAHDLRVVRELGLGLDDKAIEAVKKWRFAPGSHQGQPAPAIVSFAVDFFLPAKRSRWHLIQATFRPPEGASRPIFASAKYPLGAGIGPSARDEGGILVAVGRQATVRVSFEVNEQGNPVHFQVKKASEEMWAAEAIALVRDWRFTPGEKNGVPISVPCTLDLAWGERNLTRSAWERLRASADSQPLRSGGGIDMPTVIYRLDPSYSEEARNAKLEGTVVVSLVVGEDGAPRDMRIVKPLGHGLDEKAIEALAAWRFRPPRLNGQPAPVAVNVEVNFRLH